MGNGRSRKRAGRNETLAAQPGHQLVGVLRIPEDHASPIRVITRRVAIALVVLFAAAVIVYLDRNGYRDIRNERLTFLDCVYFAAVSLSTTGYGDITPYSEAARLTHTVIFTPLRIVGGNGLQPDLRPADRLPVRCDQPADDRLLAPESARQPCAPGALPADFQRGRRRRVGAVGRSWHAGIVDGDLAVEHRRRVARGIDHADNQVV